MSSKSKKEIIENNILLTNYYHINIPYIFDNIKNFPRDNKEKQKEYIHNLIYNFICNLKKLNDEIAKTKKIYYIDEYIFGIYSNLWILCDIIRYLKLEIPSSVDIIPSECDKPIYSLVIKYYKNDILTLSSYFKYIQKMLLELYPSDKINSLFRLSPYLQLLWKNYILNIISKTFNQIIFNHLTNGINIELVHNYYTNYKDEIEYNIDVTSDTYKIPFDFFDEFINFESVFDFYNKDYYNLDDISIEKFKDNKIIQYIRYLIIYSYNLNKEKIEKRRLKSKKYITITQYQGICWFIAILTGITYSKLHKKFLLDKTERPENDYSKFIYKIIDKLSSCKLTEKELSTSDCKNDDVYKLLHSFKNTPIDLITASLFEYIENNKEVSKNVLKNIKNNEEFINYNYFLSLLVDILKNYANITTCHNIQTIKSIIDCIPSDYYDYKEIIISDYKTGIFNSEYYSVFKEIYSKLNLTVTYLKIKINEDKTVKNIYTIPEELYFDSTITKTEMPSLPDANDILVLSYHIDEYYDKLIKFDEIVSNEILIRKTTNSVIYKGEEYILDYILCHSKSEINLANDGHVISGIEIDDQKYVYDSGYNITRYNIDKEFDVNCSFLKYNWNSDIFDNNYTSGICFNYLCKYYENQNNDLNVLRNLPYIDRMCFDNSKNHYIYIKKSIIET